MICSCAASWQGGGPQKTPLLCPSRSNVPHYALTVEYDGSSLSGFQLQKDAPSVQGELERALSTLLREEVRINGSGRTDAGVHATGQVAGFHSRTPLPEPRRALYALNAILPSSVSIRHLTPVPEWFHPRFSCLAREYEYLILNQTARPVHMRGKVLWFRDPIPVEELHEELQEILGERDFAAFTKEVYKEENTFRYVDVAELRRQVDPLFHEAELVIFRIRGNAFLHNMIRILVGTMLDRSRGKIQESLGSILASKERGRAGHTASPDGLYFRHAYYPEVEGASGLLSLPEYPRFARRHQAPGDM